MGREYFASKGSNYYLFDIDSDKGYAFTEYGSGTEELSAKYIISICGVVKEVDILSILADETMNLCEVYFKGKRVLVEGTGFNIYRKIPKGLPRETFIIFRIVRKECVGLTQILIPFKKGCVSYETINSFLGNLSWN